MKKYSYANKFRKELMYTKYLHLGLGNKDYDKITRAKIVEQILEYLLTNPEALETYVSFEELEFLKLLVESNDLEKTIKEANNKLANGLEGRYLLGSDNNTFDFFIPEITKEIVENYEPTGNHQYYDELFDVLDGILFTRGHLSEKELIEILIALGYDANTIQTTIHNHHRFLFEVEYNILEIYNVFYSLNYGDNFYIEEDYIPIHQYSKAAYKSFSRCGLDITSPNQKAFYDLLKEKNRNDSIIKLFMEKIIDNNDDYLDDIYQWSIRHNYLDETAESKELFLLINEELPVKEYKGDSLIEANEYRRSATFEERRRMKMHAELCPCGSGKNSEDCCLNEEYSINNKSQLDTERQVVFFEINHALLSNVNEAYNYIQSDDEEDFYNKLTDEDYVYLKDLVHMEEDLLQDFSEINDFSELENDIVNGLKNAIKDEFIAIKYENQKLVIGNLRTDEIYHVSGIATPLAIIIDKERLPIMINTRLIPLSDRIIYDAVISELPIKIGKELRESLEENFKESIPYTKISDIIKDSTVN